MAFDLYAAYPRPTLAASQAAYAAALANLQLNHSDEALPASNVSPRLTTAEQLALVLANRDRTRDGAAQRALGSLDGDVGTSDGDVDPGGDGDRCFTNP